MRVLQVRAATGAAAPIAFHPTVTVVQRLGAAERAWFVGAIGGLAGGHDRGLAGEVEAHGIRFDLDDASLALLGFDRPVSAVVRAADLPGHDPALASAAARHDEAQGRRVERAAALDRCRRALTEAVAERDAAAAALEEVQRGEGAAREAMAAADAERSRKEIELRSARDERGQREDELARAVVTRDAAAGNRDAAAHRVDAARGQRQEAIAAATAAAVALEEAKAGWVAADQAAGGIDAARARLAAAEAALAEVDPQGDESPINRRLTALEQRRVELARLAAALGEDRPDPVAKAYDDLHGTSGDGAPIVAALALADTWRDLHQQISALEAGVSESERAAEERVAGAWQAVVDAETEMNQPVLTPEQIAKVEAAHASVLEAQDRAEGRFGGNRARKRLEELRSEERRVLERLGFSTYADYMMSASSRGPAESNRAMVETIRADAVAAEQELEQLPGAAERARRRAELLQRRDAVAPRVAALLGHEPTGPESEEELRNLREPGRPTDELLGELAVALGQVGIDVGPQPHDPDDLELLARSYLAESHGASQERTEVAAATVALDGAIAALRDARGRGEVDVPAGPPLPMLAEPTGEPTAGAAPDPVAQQTLREARWSEAEAARAAVADAEAADGRRREAQAGIDRLAAELDAAAAAEQRAAAALAEAEAHAQAGAPGGDDLEAAVATVSAAEAALARARSAESAAEARLAEVDRSGVDSVVGAARERVAAAEAAVTAAAAAEQGAVAELGAVDAELPALAQEVEAATAATETGEGGTDLAEEVSWRLLARLAALRSVGPGGSVPLVLDDPFAALADQAVFDVLDRVAELAGTVQVVVVSDRPAVAEWARSRGPEVAGLHAA